MDRLFYICIAAGLYGVAAQQLLELIYSVIPPGRWDLFKKILSKGFSVGFGAAMTECLRLVRAPQLFELVLAGLIAAAASEATNAAIKGLVYAKEVRKARAAQEFSATGVISLEAMGRK